MKHIFIAIVAMIMLSPAANAAGDQPPTTSTWDDAQPVETSTSPRPKYYYDDCPLKHYASKDEYEKCLKEIQQARQGEK